MSIPFYNNLDLKNNKIENVGTPTNDTDVANKIYTDNALENLHTEITGEIGTEVSAINDEIDRVDNKIDELDAGLDNRISTAVQPIIENNIVDDTTSTDTNKSLSANQGRLLDERIEAIRELIVPNKYDITPIEVGTFLNKPLYRVVLIGEIEDYPSGGEIAYTIDDPVEPDKEYEYNIVNFYGNYTTKYDVLGWDQLDIPRTYNMGIADMRTLDLTRPQIFLGNIFVKEHQIWTWVKFGTDIDGISHSHPELLPISIKIVIEFTRQEIEQQG